LGRTWIEGGKSLKVPVQRNEKGSERGSQKHNREREEKRSRGKHLCDEAGQKAGVEKRGAKLRKDPKRRARPNRQDTLGSKKGRPGRKKKGPGVSVSGRENLKKPANYHKEGI